MHPEITRIIAAQRRAELHRQVCSARLARLARLAGRHQRSGRRDAWRHCAWQPGGWQRCA